MALGDKDGINGDTKATLPTGTGGGSFSPLGACVIAFIVCFGPVFLGYFLIFNEAENNKESYRKAFSYTAPPKLPPPPQPSKNPILLLQGPNGVIAVPGDPNHPVKTGDMVNGMKVVGGSASVLRR